MTSGFESLLNEAMAAVHKQTEELMRQQQSLKEITATSRSGRRQVSATVDARGDLVELKFHGQSYKNLTPDDLGRLVVDTVRQARHEAQTEMWESLADTLPEGANIDEVVRGNYDWTQAVGQALTLPQPLLDLINNPPTGPADGADFAAFLESMMGQQQADAPDAGGGDPPGESSGSAGVDQ